MFIQSTTVFIAFIALMGCAQTDNSNNIYAHLSTAIIDGEVIPHEQLPGVHELQIHRSEVCSSVQISETQLLTALHCSRFKGVLKEISRTRKSVGEFFPLGNNQNDGPRDLAVIALDPEKPFDPENNFELPSSDELPENLFIAGFGRNKFQNDEPDGNLRKTGLSNSRQRLLEITTESVPGLTAEQATQYQYLDKLIKEKKMLCFKPLQDRPQITSFGDSGGPLFSYNQEGKTVLHGIASFVVTANQDTLIHLACYEAVYPHLRALKTLADKHRHLLNNHSLQILDGKNIETFENRVAESVVVSKTRTLKKSLVNGHLGQIEDLKNLNLRDKIVLVQRGEITFEDKIKNLREKGAAGVIFFDNGDDPPRTLSIQDTSLALQQMDGFDIRFIAKKDGDKMIQKLRANPRLEAVLTILP